MTDAFFERNVCKGTSSNLVFERFLLDMNHGSFIMSSFINVQGHSGMAHGFHYGFNDLNHTFYGLFVPGAQGSSCRAHDL